MQNNNHSGIDESIQIVLKDFLNKEPVSQAFG